MMYSWSWHFLEMVKTKSQFLRKIFTTLSTFQFQILSPHNEINNKNYYQTDGLV